MPRRADGAAQGARPISTFAAMAHVLGEQKARTFWLVVASFIAGVCEAGTLALVAQVAAALVKNVDSAASSLGPLKIDAGVPTLLGFAAVLVVVRLLLQIVLSYLPSRMTADTQAWQRARLFEAYSRADWDTQAQERDGHLQELVTSQVVQATQAMLNATSLVSSAFMFLTLVVAAFAIGPLVALFVLVIVAALSVLLRPLGKYGRRHSKDLSAAQLAFAGRVGTAVRLAEETYTFDAAAAEREEVGERIEIARHHFMQAQYSSRLVQGLFQTLVVLLMIGALAILYAAGTGQIAGLGAAVLLLVRASSYGQQLQYSWQVIQQTAPFLERLRDAEANYRSHMPRSGAMEFPTSDPLVIDGVDFSYRGDRDGAVLHDVSFEVPPGEVIGIIGPSGAGKSTLVQLLLRMRNPTVGGYLIGALPVDDIDLSSWRRTVAYVPQEPRLRDATVADNIRFHRDIDQASIEHAARLANIHNDIVAMPHGYETVIGQRADAVSGGQRQRLCLARALAGRPSVLILDEPTSALDAASETAIQASLQELKGSLTMFIVAHRPSLLAVCDRVFRVEDGRVRVLDAASVTPTDAWQGVAR